MGWFEIFAAALAGFYAIISSYGLAIILLTLAVRILLIPLSIKQTRSMREMQRIQPEIKKIQAKHKGDRQKMNEAMMELYKEHGVNPLGGCLPILMQFPVIVPLFYVVREPLKYMGYHAIPGAGAVPPPSDFRINPGAEGIISRLQESSLATDLVEQGEKVYNFLGFHLDDSAAGALGGGLVPALPYLLLVGLIGFTTYYQQKQMQGRRGDAQLNPQMQMMGRIMPVMIMVFSFQFPAGVGLYWLTTNLWTMVQQRLVLKAVPEEPSGKAEDRKPAKGAVDDKQKSPRATGAAAKAKPATARAGGSKPSARRRAPGTKPQSSGRKKKR